MDKHDPRYEILRDRLKDLRKDKGIRQQELADRLGRPQSYVSKFEGGDRNIDLIELIDVAKALDLEPVTMISDLVKSLSE